MYIVKKEKNGFVLVWEFNKEEKAILQKRLGIDIDHLKCHMRIWTKIFYTKHKSETWNRKYKEIKVLNKITNYITVALDINKENHTCKDDLSEDTRIKIYDEVWLKNQKAKYIYVLNVDKINKKIDIISIYSLYN